MQRTIVTSGYNKEEWDRAFNRGPVDNPYQLWGKWGIPPAADIRHYYRDEHRIRQMLEVSGGVLSIYDCLLTKDYPNPADTEDFHLWVKNVWPNKLDDRRETLHRWRSWGLREVRAVATDHGYLRSKPDDPMWNRCISQVYDTWCAMFDEELPGVLLILYEHPHKLPPEASLYPRPVRHIHDMRVGEFYRLNQVERCLREIERLGRFPRRATFISLGHAYPVEGGSWNWDKKYALPVENSRFWGRMFANDPILKTVDPIVIWPNPGDANYPDPGVWEHIDAFCGELA